MECVLRVRAGVEAAEARLPSGPRRDRPAVRGARGVLPETGPTALPVYRRADLPPEHPVKGPALIEDPWATTLVYPGHTGLLDPPGTCGWGPTGLRPVRPPA